MSNCINCGAALPVNTIVCNYCGTRQDVDLKGIHHYTVVVPESERICPRCNKAMPTIDLKLGEKFLIERCNECMGMFFDPGELEALLDNTVSNVYVIDYKQLQILSGVRRHDEYPVTYIKCPICHKFMNRINFGSQSGVIVDTCRDHGIWLDGGELRQLMEWMKAGGKLHHQQREIELQKLKQESNRQKTTDSIPLVMDPESDSRDFKFTSGAFGRKRDYSDPEDLFDLVAGFIGRLFR